MVNDNMLILNSLEHFLISIPKNAQIYGQQQSVISLMNNEKFEPVFDYIHFSLHSGNVKIGNRNY